MILDGAEVADVEVATERRTAAEVAVKVAAVVGWSAGRPRIQLALNQARLLMSSTSAGSPLAVAPGRSFS
jgi:hypothetical protein